MIQCSKTLLEHGHVIKGIVSDDTSIQQWAAANQIQCFTGSDQLKLIEIGPVDYVFSITHLSIIPNDILELSRNKAINFHDGILPGNAGLNVTTWALYNQEKQHGITWHEMTEDVDTGDILKQVTFEINDNETAFTLNTRCYEEALTSFNELITDIENNNITKIRQDAGKSSFYKRCDRVPAMAIIDWHSSAQQINAMVRALDFGPYPNPVGTAKLRLDNDIYIVKESEIIEDLSGLPGEVLAIDEHLTVSAANNAIRIDHLYDLYGDEVSISSIKDLTTGQVLPTFEPWQAEILSQKDRQSCRYEPQWIHSLINCEQLDVPFEMHANDTTGGNYFENKSYDLPNIISADWCGANKLEALAALFFSRLCTQEQFSIYIDIGNKDALEDLFIEHCVPVYFDIDFDTRISDAIQYCSNAILQAEEKGGYCIDLHAREPELKSTRSLKNIVIRTTNDTDSVNIHADAALQIEISTNSRIINWYFNKNTYSDDSIERMQSLFSIYIENAISSPESLVKHINLTSKDEINKILYQWNDTNTSFDSNICIHQLFEKQVEKTPDAIAISFGQNKLSYSNLNRLSNKIAHYLLDNNITPDNLVGVLVDRSVDMIAVMMGVLKSGAAYLPLDPAYPKDRIEYMLTDGEVSAVITQHDYEFFTDNLESPVLLIDQQIDQIDKYPDTNPQTNVNSSNLAYTIYTSGSTGRPKGVMVEHRNVVNFFHGMDKDISYQNGVWLAVTSISFDISVLEIFWTLANGFEVVLYSDSQQKSARQVKTIYPDQDMQFSMFYWNVAEDVSEYDEEPYRLLMESARFADNNDFTAVWTPERHFHAFGGLYPNPAITSAALASVTENIHIRAGSCVVPLHHPIRIAEDWAVIDNISNGRVGIAVASGWQPNDFVIQPDNFADSKKILFESTEVVRRLWRGEELEFEGPKGPVKVRTLPRAKQQELPIWTTTAGNPETFRQAGAAGTYILTHLLGQSVEDVSKNIDIYRDAYKAAGHKGDGHVTLLLHTLVGPDEEKVRQLAHAPMKRYLKSAMFLVKSAAWSFPTFKTLSADTGKSLDEYFETISDEDMDELLDFAFDRYYETSGLFGTAERCIKMVDSLKEIGVNEIGCLIDYGLDTDTVLEHLPYLNELRKVCVKQAQSEIDKENPEEQSIAGILAQKNITHLQCTPSMANMLVADQESACQLNHITHMMVGGEAFPGGLASALNSIVNGRVTNMYGPTETTIWSTTYDISEPASSIPIGRPICNTEIYILDKYLQPVPIGVPGELYIGGVGVTRGYHKQPQLTDERFLKNPFANDPHSRIYRTGDLAKFRDDGTLEYLGRIDQQIKIRGYRIELGEIEALLQQHEHVTEAVVTLIESSEDDKRLVAYVVVKNSDEKDSIALRSHLQKNLPQFMVPSHFVFLDEMPKMPNGKINRNALPDPVPDRINLTDYVAPDTDLASLIAEIWSDVLEIPQVGMNDNFFDLGGHSLTAIQVVHRIRQTLEIDFSLQTIFTAPNLSDMVEKTEQILLENDKNYDANNVVPFEDPQIRAEKLMQKIMAMTEEETGQILAQQKQILKNQSQ